MQLGLCRLFPGHGVSLLSLSSQPQYESISLAALRIFRGQQSAFLNFSFPTAVVLAMKVSRQTRRRPPPKPLNKRDDLALLTSKPGQSRDVLLLPSTSAIKQIQKRFCFTTRGSQRPDVLSPSANKSASSRASYPQRQRKKKWPTLSSMTTAFRVPRSKSACSRHRSARDGTTGSPWNLALSSPKARSSTLSGILTSPGVPW